MIWSVFQRPNHPNTCLAICAGWVSSCFLALANISACWWSGWNMALLLSFWLIYPLASSRYLNSSLWDVQSTVLEVINLPAFLDIARQTLWGREEYQQLSNVWKRPSSSFQRSSRSISTCEYLSKVWQEEWIRWKPDKTRQESSVRSKIREWAEPIRSRYRIYMLQPNVRNALLERNELDDLICLAHHWKNQDCLSNCL